MQPLELQHAELVRAMLTGVLVALLAAGLGSWIIGRHALTPLTDMAVQATRINEHDPRGRLSSPHTDDELGQLTAAFNGLLDRLAAALDQQRQFMADASHELRTPVSIVRTASQVVLAKADRSPAEYRESLEIVADQATRLTGMVDAMFLLARAEAHGVPLSREFVNLDDLLHECARALRVRASQRGVSLTLSGDQEVAFSGDDGLLRQMVANLLDNAIRHAGADGQVTADLQRVNGHFCLRVTNDGGAIAPSDQQRIFERFVRVGPSDGAGLGLPIARWIAEAHGGSLDLQTSAPGETTFVVTLPADGRPSSAAAE
jgi:two-component system, OmpR family, sensor kinase